VLEPVARPPGREVARRQQHHRRAVRARVALEVGQQRALGAAQLDVDERHVGRRPAARLERLGRVAGLDDRAAVALEDLAQPPARAVLLMGDEDLHR
jgi:hypothetical protein